MLDAEKWAEIFATIGKNKLRTALTGFSVFWGIFMLIILLGTGQGLSNGFSYNFRNTAKNTIDIWGGQTTKPWQGLGIERQIQLTTEDVDALRHAVPGLQHINGNLRVWRGQSQLSRGKQYGNFTISGVTPDFTALQDQQILQGRFLNWLDEDHARKVIVLAEDSRDALFKGEDPIGQWVQVNNIPFQVVGIYRFESSGRSMNQSSQVFIPLSVVQKVFNQQQNVDKITFSFADGTMRGAEEAATRATVLLSKRHHFDPTDDRAIYLNNNVANAALFGQIFTGINAFLWIIGIGTIVAGIVGVSNIMLITVKERTREIGIRKALGATPANVVSQVIMEAVFVSAMAGYLGLVCGVGLLELIASNVPGTDMFRDPSIKLGTALWATLVLVVAGGLAGLIPARRAAAIRPIEALRDE